MSWNNFKTIMKSYMENQNGIKSKEDFAKQFTNTYDLTIKAGSVIVKGFGGSPLPSSRGNKELMENLMVAAAFNSLSKTETGKHQYLKDVGNAVKGYWAGAELFQIPPTFPAPGSYQNLMANSGFASSQGQWPETPPEFPTDNVDTFLDLFVAYAQAHLATIDFTINTTSLYFGFPLIPPLPGVVTTKGYSIPQ
jgi:hypothetical protein